MKMSAQIKIKSTNDLELRKQFLKAYIHSEEQKAFGKLPAVTNPLVMKVVGVAGAFLLKSLLTKVFK